LQNFHYHEEFDLTHTDVLEKVWIAMQYNTTVAIVLIIFASLCVLTIGILFLNTVVFNFSSVNEMAIAFLLIFIFCLSGMIYVTNDNFNYLGYYEADATVVSLKDERTKALVKVGDIKEPIEADIPNGKTSKKGDEVIVRTTTKNYFKKPEKERYAINFATEGRGYFIKER